MFSILEDIYKKLIYADLRIMLSYFWKCILIHVITFTSFYLEVDSAPLLPP